MTIIKQFAKWLDEDVDGIAHVVQLFCKAVIFMLCLSAFFALLGILF